MRWKLLPSYLNLFLYPEWPAMNPNGDIVKETEGRHRGSLSSPLIQETQLFVSTTH